MATQQTPAGPPPVSVPTALAGGEKILVGFARMHGLAWRSAMRWQAETLGFLKRRAEEEVSTAEEILACEKVERVPDVLADFYQKAFTDYANEAARLVDLGAKLVADGAKELRRETREAVEEEALKTVA